MDWLEHAVREHSYISGAIVCVVIFGILRAARSQPVRSVHCMAFCVICGLGTILEVRRFWQPTLVHSAFLVGIPLTCFLFGFMLTRLDPITFDPATRQFIREQPVLGSALRALLLGAVIAFAPLYLNLLGAGTSTLNVAFAWLAGSSLCLWQRTERAQWA